MCGLIHVLIMFRVFFLAEFYIPTPSELKYMQDLAGSPLVARTVQLNSEYLDANSLHSLSPPMATASPPVTSSGVKLDAEFLKSRRQRLEFFQKQLQAGPAQGPETGQLAPKSKPEDV